MLTPLTRYGENKPLKGSLVSGSASEVDRCLPEDQNVSFVKCNASLSLL